jgi:hypothetical protein
MPTLTQRVDQKTGGLRLWAAVRVRPEPDASAVEAHVLDVEAEDLRFPSSGEQEGRDDGVKTRVGVFPVTSIMCAASRSRAASATSKKRASARPLPVGFSIRAATGLWPGATADLLRTPEEARQRVQVVADRARLASPLPRELLAPRSHVSGTIDDGSRCRPKEVERDTEPSLEVEEVGVGDASLTFRMTR